MPRSTGARAPLEPRYDERATMSAWEDFLSGKNSGAKAGVRPLIEHSWKRSQAHGVNAGGEAAPLNSASGPKQYCAPSASTASIACTLCTLSLIHI